MTYRDWNAGVWNFGSTTDLPQLLGNPNSELNLKPYIRSSTELVVRIDLADVTQLPLEVDYAGTPGERVTLTWSLSGIPDSLSDFVYFDLGRGMTSTTLTVGGDRTTDFSTVRLEVVGNKGLAGKSFHVVLGNNVSTDDDRILIQNVGSPMVDGGMEQIRSIEYGSTRTTLSFSATDLDNSDSDGAGLSWGFFSRDDIAAGSTVVFTGTTTGGAVEVEVRRSSPDLYDVGSFVLEVVSPAGARTLITVAMETACSQVPGEDLASANGSGSKDEPYQIMRLCQLQDIGSRPTAYFELAAEINGNSPSMLNDGEGFEPIANFRGSFVNPGNHVIRSLAISRSSTDNVGLFSRLAEGATIRDVILVGSRVTGRNNVGLLVGVSAGVIEGCSVTGSVFGSGNNVGGLVGESLGSISNSYAGSTVTGVNDVGGLVGYQAASSVTDSYATGSVSGVNNVGGLMGESLGSISNSYAASTVTGVNNVGGLVGLTAMR